MLPAGAAVARTAGEVAGSRGGGYDKVSRPEEYMRAGAVCRNVAEKNQSAKKSM